MLSTGEEVPAGQSLRARMAVVWLSSKDIKFEMLSLLQRQAADGVYAEAMAGYIMWLAGGLEEARDRFRGEVADLRELFSAVGHKRTADVMAQLLAAWRTWLRFAVAVGAISEDESTQIETEMLAALHVLAAEQDAAKQTSDPVERFFDLLRAVLASGKGHICRASPKTGGAPPDNPAAHGWRSKGLLIAAQGEAENWEAQGDCIGWADDIGLYLEPDAAFAAVQRIGVSMGSPVAIKD